MKCKESKATTTKRSEISNMKKIQSYTNIMEKCTIDFKEMQKIQRLPDVSLAAKSYCEFPIRRIAQVKSGNVEVKGPG